MATPPTTVGANFGKIFNQEVDTMHTSKMATYNLLMPPHILVPNVDVSVCERF